jgi:hypothetical protein
VKVLAGLLAAVAILCAGAALWHFEPWADDEDPTEVSARGEGSAPSEESEPGEELTGSACREMAGLAARLAARERDPSSFLRAFGRDAAGIRKPPDAYADLARGGRNLIVGRGFLERFDDGSAGQVRHFAGIAVASTFGGGGATRFLSIFVRDDSPASADGKLTDEGILFADKVLDGELALEQTPSWLLGHLCRRK